MTTPTATAGRISLLVLFTISGFAGLIYESIWSHYLKLFLGHAAYAQTLVLVIFMGGMALGAWWTAKRSARLRNLLLGYAVAEAVIGMFAVSFHPVFRGATGWAFDSVIPWLDSVALIGAFKWLLGAVLILPQSILLGMTFPLMSGAIVRQWPERSGQTLALLYFTNSLGAAIGVLVGGFVLIALVGLPGTIMTAGLLNLLLAAVVWRISKQHVGAVPLVSTTGDAAATATTASLQFAILAGAFATGAAAFMYEIAWIRMLALVLGSSTHAFELMLSAFIFGIALGGWWVRDRIQKLASPLRFLGTVMVVMATIALVTLYFYNSSFDWMAAVVKMFSATEAGFTGYHIGSHAIALVLMVPTTVFCGMTLPIMTSALMRSGAGERAIGTVYAWNTLGAITGIVLAVHLLMPLLGVKGLMIAGAAVHTAFGIFYLTRERSATWPRARLALVGIAALAFLLAMFAIQLDPRRMTSGVFRHGQATQDADASVVFFEHGKTASISLVRENGAVTIATNGKPDAAIQMAADGPVQDDEITMVVAAGLPLAMLTGPKTIANIGIGSGLTTHVLLMDPGVVAVDSIEIEPVMAKAARLGFMPRVRNTFEDPRSHLHFEDAKTFFATSRQRYDLIVSEPSNPWVSGVASLFSAEFYGQVTGYLQPTGLFVQWLQIYETDTTTLMSVLRALAPHFSDFALYRADDANVLIVAAIQGEVPQPDDRVFRIPALQEELSRVQVTSPRDFKNRFIGNRALLLPAVQAAAVPANSDYFPYIDQHAIRMRILRRNAAEVTALSVDPTAMLDLLLKRAAPAATPEVRRNPSLQFDRLARQATAIFDSIIDPELDLLAPDGLREVELLSATSAQCTRPAIRRAWLDSLFRIARTTTPTLGAGQLDRLWKTLGTKPCAARLEEDEKAWLGFLRAVALRQGPQVASLGRHLLEGSFVFDSQAQLAYAAQATLSALLAQGDQGPARKLLQDFAGDMTDAGTSKWVLDLLAGLAGAKLVAIL